MIAGLQSVFYQGLDYSSVLAVMDAWGVKNRPKVFKKIMFIETGALSVIHDR